LLAHIYALRGELASAERELEAIVQRHPRPLGARIMLGVLAQRAGKTKEAETHYTAALVLDPHAAVAANNLAGLLAERGDLERAAALAKQAVADLPDRAEVSDTLADIYMRQSQPALAEPLWREIITRDPQPAYRYRLARALRALGRGDEARAELERALAGKAPFAERADAEKALAELPRPAGS
jgi:Tfp pilus assembly protein PilF